MKTTFFLNCYLFCSVSIVSIAKTMYNSIISIGLEKLILPNKIKVKESWNQCSGHCY